MPPAGFLCVSATKKITAADESATVEVGCLRTED